MVRLRMQRQGRHNRPFYRIAVMDERTRRDGPIIEDLGWYDPHAKDVSKQIQLAEDRVKYWLSVGAQPSETVSDMLAKRSLIDVSKWTKGRESRKKAVAARKVKLEAAAAAAEAAKAAAKK